MSNEIAEKVEDAQRQLHKAVIEALDEFTRQTGLAVSGMSWQTSHLLDAGGHTKAVNYWDARSDLRSGAW